MGVYDKGRLHWLDKYNIFDNVCAENQQNWKYVMVFRIDWFWVGLYDLNVAVVLSKQDVYIEKCWDGTNPLIYVCDCRNEMAVAGNVHDY